MARQTLTLPLQPAPAVTSESEWRRRRQFRHRDGWRNAEALAELLSPRLGVQRVQLNRSEGTLTIEYDPTHFSLDQVKALAREVGLVLGGGVHHCILDLPDMARAEYAGPLEENLMQIPGVAHAAVNPSARTLTVEYFADAAVTDEDIIGRLQDWGYRVRDFRLPAGWWDRHHLAVYSTVTAVALMVGWLLERAGSNPILVTILVVIAYLAGGGFAARNALRALRQGQIDVDTLMVTAALGAAFIKRTWHTPCWSQSSCRRDDPGANHSTGGRGAERTRPNAKAAGCLRAKICPGHYRRGGTGGFVATNFAKLDLG